MNRFKSILSVVESVEGNKPALERAVALAEYNQASLLVVDVVDRIAAGIGMPEGGPISADLQAFIENEKLQSLDSLVEPYRKRVNLQSRILRGTPFLEIIREVLRNDHDLLIKSPKVRTWLDRVFDSNDMHLLRKCPCPVWLVKPDVMGSFDKILAAVDVDDSYPEDQVKTRQQLNKQILELAGTMALTEFAELHIVSVWNASGESFMHTAMTSISEEQISEYVNKTRQHYEKNFESLVRQKINSLGEKAFKYLKPKKYLLKGSPRKEIPALAEKIEADLVVMGTVARTGISGFIMGNTAETILNRLNCSVLALKPPGFVSPVTLEG